MDAKDNWLVDLGNRPRSTFQTVWAESFDCVMMALAFVLTALFEKLPNIVHAEAPSAKICFNTTPADSAEAVQRWV